MISRISILAGKGRDGGRDAVSRIDLAMGDVVSVVGRTGSGKTTLINDIELFADGDTPTGRRLLFDGALGFAPAPPFTTFPSLLGWQWNDDFADESLTVYEHPKTILFQKVRDIPADELAALILNAPVLDNADAVHIEAANDRAAGARPKVGRRHPGLLVQGFTQAALLLQGQVVTFEHGGRGRQLTAAQRVASNHLGLQFQSVGGRGDEQSGGQRGEG